MRTKVIGRGYNRRMVDHSALAHAEIAAIKKACKRMGDWRLEECELYVTLEPCPMCAGAIVQARIPKVYIGSMNPKAGCAGSVLNLLDEKRIQSSGGDRRRTFGRGMFDDVERIFQRIA